MFLAPMAMTGVSPAALAHSRAAVAQPVDEASIPVIAVSYSPMEPYGALTRRTHLPGFYRRALGQRPDFGAYLRQNPRQELPRLVDAAQDTGPVSGANSMVTTGLMFSLRRIVIVRCR